MRDAVAVCSPGCAAVLTPDEGMRLLNTSCRGVLNRGRPLRRPLCYCGFRTGRECPRPFLTATVEASARSRANPAQLAAARTAAESACRNLSNGHFGALPTGGWCLEHRRVQTTNGTGIVGHRKGSSGLVEALDWLLKEAGDSSPQSVIEFGAGVGQDATLLLERDPRHRWQGYDGAGNVESVTGGFVCYADMSMPLALRRADWAMAIEAGEHVPREHEGMFVRNLHAHNCVGVVLTWAKLDQGGHGHVNTHDPPYVRSIFHDLGYVWDQAASARMNELWHGSAASDHTPAENRSLQVLRRRVTPTHCRGEELTDTLPCNAADLKCRKPADRFMRRDRVSASAASEVSGDRDAAASCSESLN